jgi:hypothetical protein
MSKKQRSAADQLEATSIDQDLELARLKGRVVESERKRRESLDRISDLEAQLEFVASVPKPRKVVHSKKKASKGQAAACLVLADWHAEEEVVPESVSGLNEYSLDVFEQRIVRCFEKAPVLLRQSRGMSEIDEFVVVLLGDLVSGYIHEELQEENQLGPMEAVWKVQDHLHSGIEFLRKEVKCESFRVVACYGNHGRTTKRKRHGSAYKTSLEWLLHQIVAVRNPEVEWEIARGYHNTVDVKGNTVRFHHGDAIRYQGGVGGITIPVNKAIASWNKGKRADYDVFAHWHQFHRSWNWVCCGTLMGYNAFAVSIKAEYQPPTQAYLVFDRNKGMVTAEPVFVED